MNKFDWNDFFYYYGFLIIIFCFVLLIGGTASFAVYASSRECVQSYVGSTIQSRWSFFGGCNVKAPGVGWMPSERYNYNNVRHSE